MPFLGRRGEAERLLTAVDVAGGGASGASAPCWRRALLAAASAPFAVVFLASVAAFVACLASPCGPDIGQRIDRIGDLVAVAACSFCALPFGVVGVVGLLAALGWLSWRSAAAAAGLSVPVAGVLACALAFCCWVLGAWSAVPSEGAAVQLAVPAAAWPALLAAAALLCRRAGWGAAGRRARAFYVLVFLAALAAFTAAQPFTGALWPFVGGVHYYGLMLALPWLRPVFAAGAAVLSVAAAVVAGIRPGRLWGGRGRQAIAASDGDGGEVGENDEIGEGDE